MRIHLGLWRAAFLSALVLIAAISVSGQQSESATNQTQSAKKPIQVNYRGRSGTIFANGEHTFLCLEGESKSWEIVQVRKNDDSRFTLQSNDAIFITVNQGQLKIVDTSKPTEDPELGPPESAAIPEMTTSRPSPPAGSVVVAQGAHIVTAAGTVDTTRFTIERTDQFEDGARVYKITLGVAENVGSPLRVRAVPKDDEAPHQFSVKTQDRVGRSYERIYSVVDTLPGRNDGPFLTLRVVPIPGESSSLVSPLVARSPYQQPKYPVHADKDSDNRFFYHITVIDGQPPVSVSPRIDPDVYSKVHRSPLSVISPNIWPSIIASIDFTIQWKNGDHQRDWMFVDQQRNITYFQLSPEHKLEKGKDGAWAIQVSTTPFTLYDPKHPGH